MNYVFAVIVGLIFLIGLHESTHLLSKLLIYCVDKVRDYYLNKHNKNRKEVARAKDNIKYLSMLLEKAKKFVSKNIDDDHSVGMVTEIIRYQLNEQRARLYYLENEYKYQDFGKDVQK